MTLLESPADLRELNRYCDNGEFLIEANDMGAVGLLNERGLPFCGRQYTQLLQPTQFALLNENGYATLGSSR